MVFEIIDAIAGVTTLLALVIAAIQLGREIKVRREDELHNRRKSTLDAYNTLQREVFDSLYIDFTPSRIKEIAEHPQMRDNINDYHLLGTYTARIEHFCVGVVKEVYDWEIVYELSHGFFDRTVRSRIAPLVACKANYAGYDPFENTKKVYEMMDEETKKRKKGS